MSVRTDEERPKHAGTPANSNSNRSNNSNSTVESAREMCRKSDARKNAHEKQHSRTTTNDGHAAAHLPHANMQAQLIMGENALS